MLHKPAPSSVPLAPLLQDRWSPRAFDASKPLSEQQILTLLEAARWSPSCSNEQPWRFVVCHKQDNAQAWQTLLGCLAEKNQLWAQNAPLLVLAAAADSFTHNGKSNRWAAYDTGAAVLSMCLQATALGLVTHQMGGFDADCARLKFGLPDSIVPMSVIAIGYQAAPESLNDEFQQRELAERNRFELSERVGFGSWSQKP